MPLYDFQCTNKKCIYGETFVPKEKLTGRARVLKAGAV